MRVQSCTALGNVATRAVTGAHVFPGSFGASLRHASIGLYVKPDIPFTSSSRWSCRVLYRKGRDRPRFVSINAALFPGNVVTDPIVRDALAFVFSAIGATTLVAFFEIIRAAGYVDQVRGFFFEIKTRYYFERQADAQICSSLWCRRFRTQDIGAMQA